MDVTKEFPGIPQDFSDFKASPSPFDTAVKELKLKNHSKFAVLFKVKCTNNKHIRIDECSDILRPGNETTVPITKLTENVSGDSLYVIYTIVGKQWHDERMSAFRCWERAKKQAIATKCLSIRMKKLEKKGEKEKSQEEEEE